MQTRALPIGQVEGKQAVLESSKKGLEEEKKLLDRGKREAGAEADQLDQRREVSGDGRWLDQQHEYCAHAFSVHYWAQLLQGNHFKVGNAPTRSRSRRQPIDMSV